MEYYRYRPLLDPNQDIRLLHLLPGQGNTDIRICIEHVPLIACPALETRVRPEAAQLYDRSTRITETRNGVFEFDGRPCYRSLTAADTSFNISLFDTTDSREIAETRFEALSYAWGSIEEPVIQVAVVPMDKRTTDSGNVPNSEKLRKNETIRWLSIRKNVESALRHLRDGRGSRTLWIDSICIDQANLSERNAQIGRMASIYGLADRVIAWTGEDTQESNFAIGLLRDLGDQIIFLKGHFWTSNPQSTKPSWANPREKLPLYNTEVQAIERFFARSYFERLWVWQEVILANTRTVVQCGEKLILWTTLRRSIIRLFDRFSNFPDEVKFRYRHVLSFAVSGSESNMFRLIKATALQKCTDPRDKVYGILGLITPTMRARIQPNYSHTVSRVYKDIFVAYIGLEKSLRLLGQCHLRTRKINGPSWVPDWSICPTKCTPKMSAFFSSLGMATNASFTYPDLLKVNGICCGTIEIVGTHVIGHNLSFEDLDLFRSSISRQGAQNPRILLPERWLEVFGATTTPAMTLDILQSGFESYFNSMERDSDVLPKPSPLANAYLKHMASQTYGHRMIISSSGMGGFAPDGAQSGDVICVFLGCELPVLLRLHESGLYQVVGVMYVVGLYYGEAFLGTIPHPWRVQTWHSDDRRLFAMRFWNSETGETTFEDPRLPPLMNGWELRREIDNQNGCREFINRNTGKTTSDDPRMTRDLFESRGAKIETFTLVEGLSCVTVMMPRALFLVSTDLDFDKIKRGSCGQH